MVKTASARSEACRRASRAPAAAGRRDHDDRSGHPRRPARRARDRRGFRRPAPAARPARGEGRGGALLVLLRRALRRRPARPGSTSRCSSARSRPAIRSASAKTILDANIFGGMCARVCPTETLCEEACVRNAAEGKPVQIGGLQRYATDARWPRASSPTSARADRRKRVAVVGAGPAGLCLRASARAARPRRRRLRGAAETRRSQRVRHRRLQDADDFAQREVDFILGDRRHRRRATARRSARDFSSPISRANTTRCSSASGLPASTRSVSRRGRSRASRTPSSSSQTLRQAADLAALPVGRRVVGHRRRHDGDRCGRAVETARRRGGDDRLPPRPGADEARAASSRNWRRPTASSSATGCGRVAVCWRGRQRPRASSFERTAMRGRPARRHGRDLRAAGRPGVQGDRTGFRARPARRRGRSPRARRRPHRGRRRSAAPRSPASGPAATARRRRRT